MNELMMHIVARQYGITPFPEQTPEAMAYIPFQQMGNIVYSAEQGVSVGTMFPELDKPFEGASTGGGSER